jgi:pimeloyl-ACP methyl ester carboxylesterase
VLLLHGFPTSSHMFRDLIPALADRYYVVAPDLY